MTQRERTLAIFLGVFLVGIGGYTTIVTQVWRPMVERNKRIDRLTKVRDDLLRQAKYQEAARENWREVTTRTLGVKPLEAQTMFYDDVAKMWREAGLTEMRLSPRAHRTERKGDRVGFVEITIAADGKGTLPQVVDFLERFYARPYYGRVDSLSLDPVESQIKTVRAGSGSRSPNLNRRGGRGGDRGESGGSDGGEEPVLTVGIDLTTLILPEVGKDLSAPLDPNMLRDPGQQSPLPEYDRIAEANILKLYREPPVREVVQAPPRETPVEQETPVAPPPPRGPPPTPWDEFVLVGSRSLNGEPVVDVRDPRDELGPLRHYRPNDSVHDGTIVLIHPVGMVVRKWNSEGGGEDYVYKLGDKFGERVLLDQQRHPDLFREVQIALGLAQVDAGN